MRFALSAKLWTEQESDVDKSVAQKSECWSYVQGKSWMVVPVESSSTESLDSELQVAVGRSGNSTRRE